MIKLPYIQNKINFLLSVILNGTYLSNKGKFFYPFLKSIHNNINQQILNIKNNLCHEFDIKSTESPHEILAESIKCFKSRVNRGLTELKSVQQYILKIYDLEHYKNPKFMPIKRLCEYIKKNLEPYLIDAFIHGSLSTMDYTEYSDLDTFFIIKQKALEDPEQIKELEKLFIKSTRYLYEFDPLQHHSHFFLIESDLKFYNQSFLPLSAIELSTSILGRGNNLTFYVRDSKYESEQRFIESIKVIRRYAKDVNKLKNLYYLKRFFSHFMILPVLFLQLKGEYVSKKDSFDILRERLPANIWDCMEKASAIRQNWNQTTLPYLRGLTKMVGMWNPLMLRFLIKYVCKNNIVRHENIDPQLLSEMYDFTEYLFKLSGIDGNRLED